MLALLWPRRAATRSRRPSFSGLNRNTLRKKIRELDIQVIRTVAARRDRENAASGLTRAG